MNRQGIYRLVRAKSKPEQSAVDVILGEFFTESEQGWRNARADREIEAWQSKSSKAKSSAEQRWHTGSNAGAMRTHSDGNANQNHNQEPEPKPNPESREKRSQGSRLPPGWFPSESLKAWAEKERGDLNVNTVIASFRDYWIAVPGSKGLKLDWEATFRNWVRKERQGGARKEINYDALVAKLQAEENDRAGV